MGLMGSVKKKEQKKDSEGMAWRNLSSRKKVGAKLKGIRKCMGKQETSGKGGMCRGYKGKANPSIIS